MITSSSLWRPVLVMASSSSSSSSSCRPVGRRTTDATMPTTRQGEGRGRVGMDQHERRRMGTDGDGQR
eukprot:2439885-Alexandrium_andersonii.AAC.1